MTSTHVRLAQVTRKIGSGATPRGGKAVYVKDGTAFIRSQNVHDGRFSRSGLARITQEAADQLRAVTVEPGDVLICITGESVTRTCLVDPGVLPARVSQHVAIVRADPNVLDARYLMYALVEPRTKGRLDQLSQSGATRRALTKGHLESLGLDLPPLYVQRRIAGVLGALDDLIEIDTDLAARNLALAQAAVARGVNSGAVIRKVEEVAEFENRKRVPLSAEQRAAMPGPFPYYGAAGPLGTVGRFLFDGHRVLVGEDGTVVRDAGAPVVQSVWGRYWVNNHAHVLAGMGISNDLLRLVLLASDVSSLITGAVQPKLSMGNLKAAKVAIPSDSGIDTQVQLLGHAERSLLDEAGELRRVRDELLPLLMSGHVTPGEVA